MERSRELHKSRILQLLFIVICLFFCLQILFILQPQYQYDLRDVGLDYSTLSFDDEKPQESNYGEQSGRTPGQYNIGLSNGNGPKTPSYTSDGIQRNGSNGGDGYGNADGTFNTFPIFYKEYTEGFHSNAHCIGNNFQENAWKFQSCHFQNLCFDTTENKFVLFTSQEQIDLETALSHSELTHFSPASSMNTTVSLGALNPKWGQEHLLLRWYPELRSTEDLKQDGYYILPTDKVLIPFHSMAGFNPGHLVWDDFLPLYTLLTSFDLLQKEMIIIRYDLTLAMWASCQRQWSRCQPILRKFLPLLGTELEKTSTQNQTSLLVSDGPKSKYVCSPHGAAGMGLLSDHGFKLHGWMMENIGVNSQGHQIHTAPYRIILSEGSSSQRNRHVSFKQHAQLLQERLGQKYEMDIRVVKLSSMTLKEQVELTSGASIFITMCGGGAVTAMFLPKGASMFVYFNEMDGDGETPARLDWDFLNNMGYIRVHWLPRPRAGRLTRRGKAMPGPQPYDFEAFVRLVDHELDVISHTNDY